MNHLAAAIKNSRFWREGIDWAFWRRFRWYAAFLVWMYGFALVIGSIIIMVHLGFMR